MIKILKDELKRHNLNWCRGCAVKSSHKRGFVLNKDKTTIHYDSNIVTRKALHGGLHEIGHCINDEKGLRRFQREANAEAFANQRMKELGIAVPRDTRALGKAYVKRWKQFGDKIKRSKK